MHPSVSPVLELCVSVVTFMRSNHVPDFAAAVPEWALVSFFTMSRAAKQNSICQPARTGCSCVQPAKPILWLDHPTSL